MKQFCHSPIHVWLQQLRIEKKDEALEWRHPQRIDVVRIQCVHHLHKTTMEVLIKTFNSTKPRDVQNQPNGTNMKCVPWYSDCNSPDPSKLKLATTMIAKRKHKGWLNELVHISLGMVEELQLPIETEEEGEISLHQVLMSLRSKVVQVHYISGH